MDSMELSNFHWVSISNSNYIKVCCVICVSVWPSRSVWVRAATLIYIYIIGSVHCESHVQSFDEFIISICLHPSIKMEITKSRSSFENCIGGLQVFQFHFFLIFQFFVLTASFCFFWRLISSMQRLDSDFNFVVVVVVRWPVWRWHIDIGTINDAAKKKYNKEMK